MRTKRTNAELSTYYTKRLKHAGDRLERATEKILRAAAYLARVKNEQTYLHRQRNLITASMNRGETYPPRKEKRQKAARRIELD